ncbi:MAG: DUF4388 domain-containing protein [Vicinamibacteria bacterium]
MSFAEKGAVGDIDPAFFIGYLHRQKATGTLKFEDTPIQRAIYFRDGRVLFSASNAAEDQLGAILVAAGKIGQDQFNAIVATLEPKQSIAAALAQGGHVSQRDIGDAARRKVEQIIASCCAQTTGQFEFEDGDLPKGALDLKLTTERVLISAFEVLEPSGFLSRILKSPMAVLARADAELADPDLLRLHEALDGESSLADIGGKVGLPLAATEARAAVLVVLGAATVVTSQIEEMSLPDTGETSTDLAISDIPDGSEPIAAETIAFGHTPGGSETVGFGQAPDPEPSALGGDSTLMTPPSPGGESDTSGDATLVMGADGGIPEPSSPSQNGARRATGVRRERASTQDLDAVNELLGAPSSGALRPGSASIPSQRWEPVLSARGRPGRDRSGVGGILGSPVMKSVAAFLLLAVVLAFGWVAYTSQNRQTPRPPVANVPSLPSPSPVQAVDAAPPSGAVPPPLADGASPAVAASPAMATPSQAAVSPLPTPHPPTPVPPTPGPTKPAEKAAAPVRSAPTPGPAPTVAPKVASAGRPGTGGYDALKAGRLAEAAAAFESVAQSRSSEFSVQLLVACSPQTIEKALQNDPSTELFVLPATVGGKSCHRLMRGFFPTTAEAAQSVSKLPGYYAAEGAKPKAVPLKSVLR